MQTHLANAQSSRDRLRTLALILLTLATLTLTACAPGPNTAEAAQTAGFLQGLWHGIIAPITFIISLFNDNVSIYEVVNNGGWYDVGFMVGVSTIFGTLGRGGGAAVPARSRRR